MQETLWADLEVYGSPQRQAVFLVFNSNLKQLGCLLGLNGCQSRFAPRNDGPEPWMIMKRRKVSVLFDAIDARWGHFANIDFQQV